MAKIIINRFYELTQEKFWKSTRKIPRRITEFGQKLRDEDINAKLSRIGISEEDKMELEVIKGNCEEAAQVFENAIEDLAHTSYKTYVKGDVFYHGTVRKYEGADMVNGLTFFVDRFPTAPDSRGIRNILPFHVPLTDVCAEVIYTEQENKSEEFQHGERSGSFFLKMYSLRQDVVHLPHYRNNSEFLVATEVLFNEYCQENIGYVIEEDDTDAMREVVFCAPMDMLQYVAQIEGKWALRQGEIVELDLVSRGLGRYRLRCRDILVSADSWEMHVPPL